MLCKHCLQIMLEILLSEKGGKKAVSRSYSFCFINYTTSAFSVLVKILDISLAFDRGNLQVSSPLGSDSPTKVERGNYIHLEGKHFTQLKLMC